MSKAHEQIIRKGKLLGMEWSKQGIHGRTAQSTSHSAAFNQEQTSHTRWYWVKIRKELFGGMPIVTGQGPLSMVLLLFCQLKEPPIHIPSLMLKKLLCLVTLQIFFTTTDFYSWKVGRGIESPCDFVYFGKLSRGPKSPMWNKREWEQKALFFQQKKKKKRDGP